ncbi:MAG TPA: succinate dehydrogenase, cytochrome b556 subunit [Woeseiaceae bacterium]|nr:succinate dehydrogenase, cytochrome b556 subunit [Woeseiaceae bacterium]
MQTRERPLSPHLFIYRWPMTMVVSIGHRLTGLLLSLGLVVLVAGLVAAATGPGSWERFVAVFASLPGRLLLALLTLAFFFHLANGIRHLAWDLGYGFEIPQANASGWTVIAASVILTLVYWLAF